MMCNLATHLCFFGGTGDWGGERERRRGGVWIPGDWGYIYNDNHQYYDAPEGPKTGNWDDGTEGENIIHVGKYANTLNMFWGHFDVKSPYHTESGWERKINGWISPRGDPKEKGDARVRDTVSYPSNGLDP